MNPAPHAWFEVLEVEADDVARVGYSLAEYADEHEVPLLIQDEGNVELQLMLATTFTEAATLLALVDSPRATDLLARAATLFEAAEAPEAWVVGMACGAAWRPTLGQGREAELERPSDGMSSLAALNAYLERRGADRSNTWQIASAFGDNPALGWSGTGVPANWFAEFASSARERNLERADDMLELIIGRSDEVVRLAQEQDRWRWHRFVADVQLLDPELLALGSVTSRVDANLVSQVEARELSPARIAILAGSRLNEGTPRERSGDS